MGCKKSEFQIKANLVSWRTNFGGGAAEYYPFPQKRRSEIKVDLQKKKLQERLANISK